MENPGNIIVYYLWVKLGPPVFLYSDLVFWFTIPSGPLIVRSTSDFHSEDSVCRRENPRGDEGDRRSEKKRTVGRGVRSYNGCPTRSRERRVSMDASSRQKGPKI